jgi:hypothetical protein
MRETSLEITGADHFLNRPVREPVNWLAWFVFIAGGVALSGFLALLARSNGLI